MPRYQSGFSPQLVFESMELTTVSGLVDAGLGTALLPSTTPISKPATSSRWSHLPSANSASCGAPAMTPRPWNSSATSSWRAQSDWVRKRPPEGGLIMQANAYAAYLEAAAKRSAISSQLKTFQTALT